MSSITAVQQPSILLTQSKPAANPTILASGADSDGDFDGSGPADSDGDRGSRLNIKA